MKRSPLALIALLLSETIPRPTDKDVEPPEGETFHGHLDKCSRCMNNPFGMCPIGNKLLEREATAVLHGKKALP